MATLTQSRSPRKDLQRDPEAELRERVAIALRSGSHESIHRLRIETADGTVTLRGRVPSYYVKQLAQELIWRLDGVRQVLNKTVVG